MSRNISVDKNQIKISSVYVDANKFKKTFETNKIYNNVREFVKNCPIQCKLIPVNLLNIKPEKIYKLLRNIIERLKLEEEYLVLFAIVNEKPLIIEGHHYTNKSKLLYNTLEKFLPQHFIWNGSDFKYIIISEDKVKMAEKVVPLSNTSCSGPSRSLSSKDKIKAPTSNPLGFIKYQKLYNIFISLEKKQKIVDIEHIIKVCKFETYHIMFEKGQINIYVFDLHKETAKI